MNKGEPHFRLFSKTVILQGTFDFFQKLIMKGSLCLYVGDRRKERSLMPSYTKIIGAIWLSKTLSYLPLSLISQDYIIMTKAVE